MNPNGELFVRPALEHYFTETKRFVHEREREILSLYQTQICTSMKRDMINNHAGRCWWRTPWWPLVLVLNYPAHSCPQHIQPVLVSLVLAMTCCLAQKQNPPHLHTIHAHTHTHLYVVPKNPQKKPLSLCLRTVSSLRSMTLLREYNFMDKPEGFSHRKAPG